MAHNTTTAPNLVNKYVVLWFRKTLQGFTDTNRLPDKNLNQNNVTYVCKLVEGKFKAFCVVGDAFGCNVLHSVFKNLFISNVGLDQVVETGCVIHFCVELEKNEKKKKYIYM